VAAGKIITLMASGVTLFFRALPDIALFAVHEPIVGQASAASNIIRGKIFASGKSTFARHLSFIKAHQTFFEFLIIIAVCNVDGADAAVKAAW